MEASIIIPVYNNLSVIKKTLDSLQNQTYSRDKYEVIVIDNGSNDGSYEYLETVDNIILLKETDNLGSPYSCRNRGIEKSTADVVVFLDSTCIPKKDFIEQGLKFIRNTECDLFGGNIVFNFDNKVTAGKVCDSVINIQQRKSIEERGVAKTGNLWVNRYVFDKVGVYLEGVRSGDDVGFTSRCREKGMKLVFCEQCKVYYAARGFKPLLKKQYRVGRGKARLWYSEGEMRMIKRSWRLFMPAQISSFKKLFVGDSIKKYSKWMLIKVYFVLYVCKQATFWGIINEAKRLRKKSPQKINASDFGDALDMDAIIKDLSQKYIKELNENGSIAGGHNGPYYDTETNVRNTAHFASIFSYMYKKEDDEKYKDAVKRCGEYLLSDEARPQKANFYCRVTDKKDKCNGTIGAAWVIEGLVEAYKVTKDQRYIDTAKEVFELFPYDNKKNVWYIVDTDGSKKSIDMTFNHQLWLAAAGVQLLSVCQNENINKNCKAFFDNINNIFSVYPNGLIKHSMYLKGGLKDSIKNIARKALYQLRKAKTGKTMKYKENGYHLFNVYAFAIIKNYGWNISLFKTKKFKKALSYCFTEELFGWLESKEINYDINHMPKVKNKKINIYGYSYNAPGFELPYIYKAFGEHLADYNAFVKDAIKKQIGLTYDSNAKSFSRNCEDHKTLDARLYEYVRCLNIKREN